MDLRIIKQRLDEAPLDSSRLRIEGNTLKNIPAFRSLVETLADVPPLKPLADVLRKSGIYQIGAEAAGFAGDQAREIAGLADEFYLTARGLKKALETLVVDVPQETVVASIPKQKDDLTSVVAVLSDLHKALAQLVSETGIGGEVRVERWETGSLLVFLFLGTLSAVGLVARTLRAAAIAYQEIQKGRLLGQHVEVLKEHVKGEKIRNDMAETFRSGKRKELGQWWIGKAVRSMRNTFRKETTKGRNGLKTRSGSWRTFSMGELRFTQHSRCLKRSVRSFPTCSNC